MSGGTKPLTSGTLRLIFCMMKKFCVSQNGSLPVNIYTFCVKMPLLLRPKQQKMSLTTTVLLQDKTSGGALRMCITTSRQEECLPAMRVQSIHATLDSGRVCLKRAVPIIVSAATARFSSLRLLSTATSISTFLHASELESSISSCEYTLSYQRTCFLPTRVLLTARCAYSRNCYCCGDGVSWWTTRMHGRVGRSVRTS
jgi:hypothetical protein